MFAYVVGSQVVSQMMGKSDKKPSVPVKSCHVSVQFILQSQLMLQFIGMILYLLCFFSLSIGLDNMLKVS